MKHQECAWLLFLFTPHLLAAAADTLLVNINLKKAAHILDEHFVSLTVNPTELLQGRPFGMGSNSTLKILQGLSPAYVRLGGPDTDHYVFHHDENLLGSPKSPDDIIITDEHWKSLNSLMRKATIDVIACLNSDIKVDGTNKWDTRNALDLITFSDRQQYNVTWELGYEYSRDNSISGMQVGKDITRLRTALNAFPRYQSSKLIGPDIISLSKKDEAEHIINILTEAGPSLDAITWHPRWPHVGTIEPEDLSIDGYEFPPDYLEWDKLQLNRIMQRTLVKKPLWISQPRGENTGSFAEGLIFARRLVLAAKLGIEVVLKQPNLNDISHPKPEYWVAVLHKKTLGRTILETRTLSNQSEVSTVTHCTSNQYPRDKDGGVTIFMVNTGSSPHKAIIRGVFSDKTEEEQLHQYILTSGGHDDSIFSQLTYLNGELLAMGDDGSLPKFTPKIKHLRPNMILKLPPYSVGFWVIPHAKVPICQTEPQSSVSLLEDPEVAKVLNAAQKGINNLRNMNQLIVDKLLPSLHPGNLEVASNDALEANSDDQKRSNRKVDSEEFEKHLKERLDEIDDLMGSEIVHYGGKMGRSESQESRLKTAEEKIDNLANDLNRYMGKGDQGSEFWKFLELTGLKKDFGQLMVNDRMARGKRDPSLFTAEEMVQTNKDGRKKRDSKLKEKHLNDDLALSLKDFKEQLNANNLGLLKMKTQHRGIGSLGLDKINRELQEDVLLKEIALLEKTEEALLEAMRNHKKHHDEVDKKLKNELSNLRGEKIATLLEMKYDSKPHPAGGELLENNYVLSDKIHNLPALAKKLQDLKAEFARQTPKKREAPENENHIDVSKEGEHRKDDPFDAFRSFLKKRRENQGQRTNISEKISELRNSKLKITKSTTQQTTTLVPPTVTPTPAIVLAQSLTSTTPRGEEKEKKNSPDLEQDDQTLDLKNHAQNNDKMDSLTRKLKASIRKTRKIDHSDEGKEESNESDVSSEESGAENSDEDKSDINSSGGETDNKGSTNFAEDATGNKPTVIGNGEEGAAKNGENFAQPGKEHGTYGKGQAPLDFQRQLQISAGTNQPSAENMVSADSTDGSTTYSVGVDKSSEENMVSVDHVDEETGEFKQNAHEGDFEKAPTFAAIYKAAYAGQRRVRRDTIIAETTGSSHTTSGPKIDRTGESHSKNAIVKKKKADGATTSPTYKPDVLNLAGSTVKVVLDDVIPEAYDQAIVKLEHLVLPDYLKNLGNVLEDMKVLEAIFRSVGGAAADSIVGTSNHVQKIDRKKRDIGEIIRDMDEEETKAILKSLGEHDHKNHEVENTLHSDDKLHDDIAKEAEHLLTDSILQEVMTDVADEVLKKEEKLVTTTDADQLVDIIREVSETNNHGMEVHEDMNKLHSSEIITEDKVLAKTQLPVETTLDHVLTTQEPMEVTSTPSAETTESVIKLNKSSTINRISSKKKKGSKMTFDEFDSDEDPSSPWLSSTQQIIEHVIKNLMKKQEELQSRKMKGKREIQNPGFPSPNSPQTPTAINDFLRQLKPGLYVVPTKDMTNVRADQVAKEISQPGSGKNTPHVVTLNIYYDKKNQLDETQENTANIESTNPLVDRLSSNINQNYQSWPNSQMYPDKSQQLNVQSPPLQHPSLYNPTASLPPRRQMGNRFRLPGKQQHQHHEINSYATGPLATYQPIQPNPVQPKEYDDSYSVVSQQPGGDDFKLLPVSSFSSFSSKQIPLEGQTSNVNWNSDGVNDAEPTEPDQSPTKRHEEANRMWYLRKSMDEPPIYVKKEIVRGPSKKSLAKDYSENLVGSKLSIAPYWNRTLKEIFQETANEPFWNFLKEPEQSYSNYKSDEDDLSSFMSGEDAPQKEEAAKELPHQVNRKKRSLEVNTRRKRAKRHVPYMTNFALNNPGNSIDSAVSNVEWADSPSLILEKNSPLDYYVTGRVLEFNGKPTSRFRRDHNRLNNNELILKSPQRLPLDSNRVTHGVLPKNAFRKKLDPDSFEIDDEVYSINGNVPTANLSPIEKIEAKLKPTTLIENTSSTGSLVDDSPLKLFYDFAMQIMKSMTAYA